MGRLDGKKIITLTEELEDGSHLEHELPTKFVVCDRCRGTGSHVNPSIDGNGITSSEMEELGDDFMEDYMEGVYDVTCYDCGGLRVVPEVDRDQCDPRILELYDQDMRAEAEYRQMCALERKMGA